MSIRPLAVAPAGPEERAAQELADREEALAEKARIRLEALRQSVRAIYRDASWDDLAGVQIRYQRGEDEVPGDLREVLTRWEAHPAGRTAHLAGPVGTGKTHAAIAFAFRHQMANPGTVVRWWPVDELLDAVRGGQTDAETTWRRVRECGLLVLDDLAHTRPTEWAVERVRMLVDHRVGAGLRTIVTSNARWDDLVAIWGAATMDRLRVGAATLRFTGRSQRKPLW